MKNFVCLLLLSGLALSRPCLASGAEDGKAAELARLNGDCDKAIELFTRAIAEELPRQKLIAAHELRGNCLTEKGQYDQAIGDFDIVLRMRPDEQEGLLGRGNAYAKRGDNGKAIQDYTEALRLYPQFPEAHVDRGLVYKWTKQYDKAESDFNDALALRPNDENTLRSRGMLNLLMGRSDQALRDFDAAVKLNPDGLASRYGRGRALLLLGRFDAALPDFDHAFQKSGNNPRIAIWRYLAEVHAKVDGRDRLRGVLGATAGDWPMPILRYFVGDIGRPAVLSAADDADPGKRAGKLCEAYTYLGELDRARGGADAAAQSFREAERICPAAYIESDVVIVELKTLVGKVGP